MNFKIPKKFPEENNQPTPEKVYVDIKSITIVKVLVILALTFVLWIIRDIIGILFVALVFASALDPLVDRLARYRIPRALSILLIYILFICLCIFVFYLIIPPLINEITQIVTSLQQYVPQIGNFWYYLTQNSEQSFTAEWSKNLANFNSTLSNLTTGIYRGLSSFFGGILTVLLVMVIAFYMTLEEEGLKKFIRSIAPIKFQPYLVQKINRIQTKMGSWLRGQLILMLIIGLLSFLGLFILGVPYALVLAVIAGLFEFVPFLGPIMAAVPAIFFAYTDSPWKAIAVVIMYFIIQQLENQVIVPQVMKKAVGLNPIVVIVVMLIGAKLAGIAGILLAVPAATIAWLFLEDIFQQKKRLDNKLEEEPKL
ncbi:MAG: hypothetical protein A2233_00120 [Candidatus Kerfeldbacteria bacterium RIFOXYA2_FULL_38_24]|uniref:AI-2E family transporter n=1 Tax=Candidatus Kerfeldbacteria bacterium RIFOXYB2_FULL_38_14 TaxID=1798547 RepID=A0A1G2BCK0_9BACT|nr:MAG: hypothetical protein A2233_00120 [Candidatus Kerfeldbacteria bacterium RIFOXYA2_FULL_38_24]OGY86000.1 MAG: hypothetical protein A2319_00325 [Candidatus Kerfeldbacteria bacterium RIFOXYB2_FULL_38_14]